jgi:ATP-dependent RNA helicase DeaD
MKNHEVYTHRSGRTGRAGQKGHSVLLCARSKRWQTERLLAAANVTIEWRQIPSAKVVTKTLEKQERRRIWAAIDSGEGRTEAHLENARRLLEAREAVDVVATLLQRSPAKMAREPLEIQSVAPRVASRPERRDDRYARRKGEERNGVEAGNGVGARKGRLGAPKRPERARFEPARAERARPDGLRRGGKDYERFEINFGEKAGATPGRLLALICRRGGVTSRDVGSIFVSSETSSFEVSKGKTRAFETQMRRPDARDPWIRVVRADSSPRPSP